MELHILAFPFPLTGHINSLLHLCRALVSPRLNFKVTFLCPEQRANQASTTIEDKSKYKIDIVALGSVGTSRENYLDVPRIMGPVLEGLIQKLKDEGHPVVCILSDGLCGWVQDVANKFGIPRAVFWTANATNDVLYLHFTELLTKGFVPVSGCKNTDLIDFLPGLPPIRPIELPLNFHQEDCVFPIFSDMAARFHEAEYALCNTFQELEEDVVIGIRREMKSKYYCVGPCLSTNFLRQEWNTSMSKDITMLSAEDSACLEWLDKQDRSSVVYVSFGSLSKMSMERTKQFTSGLEDSGHFFLLVLRSDFILSDDAAGPDVANEFLKEFRERTKNKGLVVSWAPQMQVLLHPATGGFLTHCGWNSTLEAICAGVPLLVSPQAAEQNVNCQQVVQRWKFGIELEKAAEGATIAKFVQRLMGEEGNKLRSRVSELRDMARKCLIEGGSSYNDLTAFAQAITSRVTQL